MLKHDVMSAFRPLPKIKTERLVLRRPYLYDTDDIYICMSDPGISRFEMWKTHTSNAETAEFLNGLILKYERGTCTSWVIERKKDGRAIGMINLHDIASLSRRAEIGYWIAGDCRRRGYAFEAAVAVIDFGFGKAGLNRIVGKCTADNVPSAALMKKLGMTYEGCHRKEIYIKDRFADIKVFAVLKEEW